MASLGKYELWGVPIPYVELDTRTVEYGTDDPAQYPKVGTIYDGVNRMSRMLLKFMRGLGIWTYLGVSDYIVSDWYFSPEVYTIATLVTKAGISYALAESLKLLVQSLWSVASRFYMGTLTLADCRESVKSFFTVTVPESAKAAYDSLCKHYEAASSTLWSVGRRCVEFMKEHMVTVVVALTGLASVWALYGYMTTEPLLSEEQESGVHNKQHRKGNSKRKDIFRRAEAKIALSQEQSRLSEWADSILPKIWKNTYQVLSPSGNQFGYVTMTHGRVGVCNSHFFTSLEKTVDSGEEVFLRLRKTRKTDLSVEAPTWEIKAKDIFILEDFDRRGKDFLRFEICDPRFPEHSDIRKHFARSSEVRRRIAEGLSRVVFVSFGERRIREVQSDIIYVKHENSDMAANVEEVEAHPLAELNVKGGVRRIDLIEYPINTVQGECGSLVFMGNKIIGIHSHGNGRVS